MARDTRIDAYIEQAADFARPILEHMREIVHRALPEADETIKWGMPHFTVNAKNVAGMAAFKAHCTFVIHGEGRQGESGKGEGMGQFGRITAIADLPREAELAAKLQEARDRISSKGTALKPAAARRARPDIAMSEDLASALAASPAARAVFDSFAPSHRRDYLEWITEAKTPATREKRIVQAVEWISEGKRRHWKYESR
jgi:uncharacterized protein YdeI (YjbR/CyaY-like superfamily)